MPRIPAILCLISVLGLAFPGCDDKEPVKPQSATHAQSEKPGMLRRVGQWAFGKSQKQIEAEQKAAEEARQNALQAVRDADAMVGAWAEKLNVSDGKLWGFKHHDGPTESDPWGRSIDVSYDQRWATEKMTVRSAGPDAAMGTADDIAQSRFMTNVPGIPAGVPWWGWVIVVWGGMGTYTVWRRGRNAKLHVVEQVMEKKAPEMRISDLNRKQRRKAVKRVKPLVHRNVSGFWTDFGDFVLSPIYVPLDIIGNIGGFDSPLDSLNGFEFPDIDFNFDIDLDFFS